MRVLLVHKFFNVTGGAEVFYHQVGDVLENNGHVVGKFSTLNDGVEQKRTSNDFFGHFEDYKNGSFLRRASKIPEIIYSRKNKKKFADVLKSFKPDIVHVFSIFSTISPSILDACRDYGVKVVMSCNDYKHICPNYMMYYNRHLCTDCAGGKFYSAVKNRCCKKSFGFSLVSALEAYVHSYLKVVQNNVDLFMFSSRFMADMTAKFWGSGSFSYEILKNPFNSVDYELAKDYDDYVLFFGRLSEEKGVDILLKAKLMIPEIKLKIVGSGPAEFELRELVRSNQIENVEFLGPKFNDELNPILSRAKFVVVPSVWNENFPYVINQSFAFGKAVIGSNRGGIPEMIDNGNFGLIYDAESPDELSSAIKRLYNEPDTARIMGQKAKKWSDEHFNYDVFYKRLNEIYLTVLE